jgi:6-phosphogluconolactonase
MDVDGSPFPRQEVRWHVFADTEALLQAALRFVARSASDSLAAHGYFNVVLAGGNTPAPLYRRFSLLPTDWSAWRVYFGDERCVPASHLERNSVMAHREWLHRANMPAAQVHVIPAELGAARAAARYAQTLAGVGTFDLVVLGLGSDGHTASLFPDHEWGLTARSDAVLAVVGAPKPPQARVSLSAWRLSDARRVLFLVVGAEKREAVARWRSGAQIPARSIVPPAGVDVMIDTAAFGA